jgi:hypothetical protein
MRCFLCVSTLLLATLPAPAADEAKPNTLTPKEVADGWILLFDGETTFGWQIDGEAKVADGILTLGGKKETTATSTSVFEFQDFSIALEARWEGKTPPTIGLGPLNAESSEETKTKFVPLTITGKSQPGVALADVLTVPAGTRLYLRNIKYRPRNLVAIFNGKDLTGWKEFPGKKSKFTVTAEGWLSLKDGPGDLQTVGEWADFILQLDCRSNGDRLNSGVFFRCRPGEYQQGYEAQIHNGFTAKPEKEYTLEEYDPKTHQLTGKKKVKYTATDYGTGAIYRRMPARRQVARDHEWFTMTVLAHGRHMAVWVNGIQVTDWTDNRPPSDNARNGCRLEKGPISLQGHDKTTDLSFRNIRIAELPAAALQKP